MSFNKERYAVDPLYRARYHLSSNRYRGYSTKLASKRVVRAERLLRASELCEAIGISKNTLLRLERQKLIPRPTYPSRVRMYTRAQVILAGKMVRILRREGWSHAKIAGDEIWTRRMKHFYEKWYRKEKSHGGVHKKGSGGGHDHED